MSRILYGQRKLSLGEKIAIELKRQKIDGWEREYQFHPGRKWRFDFAWIDQKIAVEIEGGIFIRGRHSQGAGYANDVEKYNAAGRLGWRIIRLTTKQLSSWSKIRKEIAILKGFIQGS